MVGTPGRVIDHIERGTLVADEVHTFILDEADEMLKMGFQDAVERVMEAVPEEGRVTNLWSATMPPWVKSLAKKYCRDLVTVDMVGSDPTRTAETIRHVAIATRRDERNAVIADIVRCYGNDGRVLVFANTKVDCDELANCEELSIMARVIHGDVAQVQRERTLQGFRDGDFNVLVATDVAARGIDVPEVQVVIQVRPRFLSLLTAYQLPRFRTVP